MSLSNTDLYPQFLIMFYSADSSGHLVELLQLGLASNRSEALEGIEDFKKDCLSSPLPDGLIPVFRLYHLTRAKI